MKNIKKIGKSLAGSALLVGATIAGAAGMGAAASHGGSSGMSLGDYPQPFVDEDGNVDSTIVVGENAKTVDVVAGMNIAGSLGNAAFTEEETSVQGASFGWSATDGVTLDTRNDDLYFGDRLDSIRETLTNDDLMELEDTTFTDDSGQQTDVESFLNIGTQSTTFGNSPDALDDEDPALHVPVPSESNVDTGNYLFSLQANMEDDINMSSDDVKGEEIELFGRSYTVSETGDDNSFADNQLVLFGASEEIDLATGESTTVTVGGQEVTMETVSVTGSGADKEAAIRVDGSLRSEQEDDTFNVNGETVRIDEIIRTGGTDSADGIVQFAIGSEELRLQDGQLIEDDNDDDVEGARVYINGDSTGYSVGDGVSSIEIFLGSQDDDVDAITAGNSWSHDMFENFVFHFGGLNPNVAEGEGAVDEIDVEPSGDDEGTIEYSTGDGEEATVTFVHDTDENDNEDNLDDARLEDSDGDQIVVRESASVYEDEYFLSDAGDFAHLWEVTNIDRDHTDSDSGSYSSDDEATVDLRDVNTGNSVEVDLDVEDGADGNGNANYLDTEIIDGQTYYFELDGDATNSGTGLEVNWGDSAGLNDTAGTSDGEDWARSGGTGTQSEYDGDEYLQGEEDLFTPVDTENRNAVAFYEPVVVDDIGDDAVFEFPSTESTDDSNRVQFRPGNIVYDANDANATGFDEVGTVGNPGGTVTIRGNSYSTDNLQEFRVGNVVYEVAGDGTNLQFIALDGNQQVDDSPGSSDRINQSAAIAMEQEDDSDREDTYVFTPTGYSEDDGYDFSSASAITYTDSLSFTQLESDDDLQQAYTSYGSFVEQDTSDEGSITVHMPAGQATAGAAVTDSTGSISAGGGANSVTTMSPAGWGDHAALDSDSDVASLRQNSNLILVGGPAVNDLVAELADENKTMSTQEYLDEGQGFSMVEMVQDAFSQGNHALVVAGTQGEDTRTAANYIAQYEDNANELAGQSQVTVSTGQ